MKIRIKTPCVLPVSHYKEIQKKEVVYIGDTGFGMVTGQRMWIYDTQNTSRVWLMPKVGSDSGWYVLRTEVADLDTVRE